jgi:hypothetical protein
MQPAKKEMINEVSKIQAQLKSYESLKLRKTLPKVWHFLNKNSRQA